MAMRTYFKHKEVGILFFNSYLSAITMMATSLISILYPDEAYTSSSLIELYLPTDYVNLYVATPLLLALTYFASKDSLAALLSLPGALLYPVYIYIYYLVGIPYRVFFILYLILVTLSLYTLILLFSVLDYSVLVPIIKDCIPQKLESLLLLLISSIFLLNQFAGMLILGIEGRVVSTYIIGQWMADFIVFGIPMFLGGILLLKSYNTGYAFVSGLLYLSSFSFLALIPIMITQSVMQESLIDVSGILIVGVVGLLCYIPYIYFNLIKIHQKDRKMKNA